MKWPKRQKSCHKNGNDRPFQSTSSPRTPHIAFQGERVNDRIPPAAITGRVGRR